MYCDIFFNVNKNPRWSYYATDSPLSLHMTLIWLYCSVCTYLGIFMVFGGNFMRSCFSNVKVYLLLICDCLYSMSFCYLHSFSFHDDNYCYCMIQNSLVYYYYLCYFRKTFYQNCPWLKGRRFYQSMRLFTNWSKMNWVFFI